MKKTIKTFLFSLLLLPLSLRTINAFTGEHVLNPNNDVFTTEEVNALNATAESLAETSGLHVMVVVDTQAADAEQLAHATFDAQGDSTDQVLIWSMNQNELFSVPFGSAATEVFTNEVVNDIYTQATQSEGMYEIFTQFIVLSNQTYIEKTANTTLGKTPSPTLYDESEHDVRLVDDANLLTESEKTELLAKLDEISQRQQIDVVIHTVQSLNGYDITAYADDFYDYNYYGYTAAHDGLVFVLAMDEREWAISTTGSAIAIFTDAAQERITDAMISDLSGGNYYRAFTTFADRVDSRINTYIEENDPELIAQRAKSARRTGIFTGGGILSILIGLFRTNSEKKKLKSVRRQSAAKSYIREGSFRLSDRRDFFLFAQTHRSKRPEPTRSSSSSSHSSTHTSSSGRTHGGSRGKF